MPRVAKTSPDHTGISRAVLMALQDGKKNSKQILSSLRPRRETVHQGTIWTILSRARMNGLVSREKIGRAFFYSLTGGGKRRVEWILSMKKEEKKEVRRIAANPKEKEE